MQRRLEREWLDDLPPDDPRALRSRRDLRRLNGWMGHVRLVAKALGSEWARARAEGLRRLRIVDLGAGDGDFCSRVALRLPHNGQDRTVILLDRQSPVDDAARRRLADRNWRVESVQADVFDWLRLEQGEGAVFMANLFLHHFNEAQLAGLLQDVACKGRLLVACEPRRGTWSLVCARWLRLIGCGPVTVHDAVASVRAGFTGGELSTLWPARTGWHLNEGRAGLFSHLFVARAPAG